MSACCAGAGRVKTEIVHFLANTFTLRKFRDQRQVLGSELDLTDFDEAEMSVQSVLEFMAQAKADNKSPAVVSLRAREGTTFNLLRMYGEYKISYANVVSEGILHSDAFPWKLPQERLWH